MENVYDGVDIWCGFLPPMLAPPGGEMEVDYDADDKVAEPLAQADPATVEVEKVPEKAKAEAEVQGLSEQAEQSLLDLLEAQKVSSQSMLAKLEKLEAERVTAEQREELLQMLLARDAGFVAKLNSMPAPLLREVADRQGMTLLHHAVRVGLVDVVEALVHRCPEAAEKTTLVDGRPAGWTPLMVLMDAPVAAMGEENYQRVMRCLLHNMSVQSIALPAYSGQTAAHLAAAQANLWAVKKICWKVYTKAGESDSAFRQVQDMLNSRSGKRGAGTVDLALGSNLQVANYLKMWGGEELCPNPKKNRYWY